MIVLAALSLLPALFLPQPGWHVGHGRRHACPGVSAARCVQASSWAATIPWRGCGDCLPHQMIRSLPPSGVVLQITTAVERPLRSKRGRSWPPTIRTSEVQTGFEGVPQRYGVYQSFAHYGKIEAYVWAFFGRSNPAVDQLAAANRELRTARLRR
jgi:hypothetical protein